MIYKNELEGRLAELYHELAIAVMNNWEFDKACIECEIEEVLEMLKEEDS